MASQILSSAKYLEISKLAQMRWLVNKCKNTETKITASQIFFLHKNYFFFVWKLVEFHLQLVTQQKSEVK